MSTSPLSIDVYVAPMRPYTCPDQLGEGEVATWAPSSSTLISGPTDGQPPGGCRPAGCGRLGPGRWHRSVRAHLAHGVWARAGGNHRGPGPAHRLTPPCRSRRQPPATHSGSVPHPCHSFVTHSRNPGDTAGHRRTRRRLCSSTGGISRTRIGHERTRRRDGSGP